MKEIIVAIVACLWFSGVSAQKVGIPENNVKFPVSVIVVINAPDSEDSCFIAASFREELIRASKINICTAGDTLFVSLFAEYQDEKNPSGKTFGKNGKHGEISLSAVSKNGKAATSSRGFVGISQGSIYCSILQSVSKEAAERFQFLE